MDAASYYSDLTAQYVHYGTLEGEAHGWHYGVWEPGVRSHAESLIRSNEILLRDLEVGPSTRILDVGFGIGGFAVWAAREFGAQVTGITLSPDHVPLARELARARGVAGRCRFLVMDMDRPAFGDGRFDVVVNQETFCHAADKPRYLAAIRRALRAGGCWRAVDFSVQEQALSVRQKGRLQSVCEGFHMPSLASGPEVRRMLQQAGFAAIEVRDLTAGVGPTAALIRRNCYLPLLLIRLRLDWLVYSRDRRRRSNRRGHVLAAFAYSRGLLGGCFRHAFYSATKPPGRGG